MKELLEEYVLENKALKDQLGMLVALTGYLYSVQDVVERRINLSELEAFTDTRLSVENGEIHFG